MRELRTVFDLELIPHIAFVLDEPLLDRKMPCGAALAPDRFVANAHR